MIFFAIHFKNYLRRKWNDNRHSRTDSFSCVAHINLQNHRDDLHKLTFFKFLYFQLDNVEACLNILRQNDVGGLESIAASDICAGRLKSVLSLFFSLSRYKQASKLKTPNRTSQTVTHQAQIHHQSLQSLNSQGDMRER